MPAIRSGTVSINKSLSSVVRESALDKLKIHSFNEKLSIKEIQNPIPLVFGYWMSLVLASSPSVRIIFKINYETRSVLEMAKQMFVRLDIADPSPDLIEDFTKEYCNLVAGSLKIIFEKLNVVLGVSLPMVTKGFDEVFLANRIKKEFTHVDYWEVTDGKVSLPMSLHIDWIDKELKSKFDQLQESDLKIGDIEFL